MKPDPVKAGELVLFTAESYSDYGITGLFKFLKDADLDKELTQLSLNGARAVGHTEFFDHLIKDGYMEEIKFTEVWTEHYGRVAWGR